MSQEELAEKLNVSRQTISNWENDKAILDAEKLAKLCTIFGVSADNMLNGENFPSAVHNQEVYAPNSRNRKRLFAIIFFAVIALPLISIAAIGLIVSDDKVSVSSIITFHSYYIWIALLIIGIAALIGMIVAFFKRK